MTAFLLGYFFISGAQTTVFVTDEKDNPLISAHVTFSNPGIGKSNTILTDLQGKAEIPDAFGGEHKQIAIQLAYVGFHNHADTIESGKEYRFSLKENPVTLNQVVVTGQYAANSPEKAIQKVKIIDRREMDARGVVNLTDALQYETNLRVSRDNQLGSSTGIQGMSGENVKIMIDGVPVIGRQDGNIDLSQINLNNIERIEIIEGPLSVNYGTNALAGTINLITKKEQKNRYEVSGNSYYESVGQYNIDGRIGFQKGRHQISLNGGRNYFNGWSSGRDFSILPKSEPADSTRNLQWKPKEQYFIDAQYVYRKDEFKFRLFTDYFSEFILDRGIPRGNNLETAFDRHFNTERGKVGFDLSDKISEKFHYKIVAAGSKYKRVKKTYFKDLTTLEEVLSPNSEDHDTTTFDALMSRGSLVHMTSNNFSWELGYDVNWEKAYGKRIQDREKEMGDYAVYGSLEWTVLESLKLKPGLRYSYNTGYQAPLIPSLNVRYELNRWVIRASYARGFRSPSLKELYFEFVDVNHNVFGNEDLNAETSDNTQLDISYKWVRKQTITRFNVGVFYNEIENMISLAQSQDVGIYRYVNIGQFRSRGMEVSIDNSHNHLKTSIGFAYWGRQSSIENPGSLGRMLYSPELKGKILYEFKRIAGNISLFYKYNGVLPNYGVDDNGQVVEVRTDDYHLLDITATKYLFKNKLSLSAGAKNLLDVQNLNSSGATGGTHTSSAGQVPVAWGRTFFASLKINLGWK